MPERAARAMSGALARMLYSALLRLALPLYLARLWWRGRREPLYRHAWAERMGRGQQGQAAPVPGRVWVHAVSLGETLATRALLDALRARKPDVSVLLTHGTATGREAGAALLQPDDAQAWLPYDTPGAVRRFLRRHRPAVGVLMETEVWPNLLHAAQQERVPVLLANARLSARSLKKGLRLRALLRPAVASFRQVLAQTNDDAERLRQAGATRVSVAGNLKFDLTPDAAQLASGRAVRRVLARPVLLMASSREGEEVPLLKAWVALPGPRPLLLLVPRHPQRFDEVAGAVTAAGLTLTRRSRWAGAPLPADDEALRADVWLGDSMGEMALYYGLADVALLGGSFAPLGGHNLIEAAACGCPLVMGPHTFNFAHAAQLAQAAGAAWREADLPAAVARALALAADPARRAAVQRALAFAAQHRGAAQRMAAAVLASLPALPSS